MTLGFITSEPMAGFIKELESELQPHLSLLYLIVHEQDEPHWLYQDYLDRVDCFVFTGRGLYYDLSSRSIFPEKPFYILDELEGDLSAVFLSLVLGNRDYDFSRVYIDFAVKENDYLGIRELFSEDQLPHLEPVVIEDLHTVTPRVLDTHIRLHREGKVDLSITKHGLILRDLEREGIPYIYLFPSREYIVNFFMQIAVNLRGTGSFHPGVIALTWGFSDTEISKRVIDVLNEIARLRGYDFTPELKGDSLMILTRFEDIQDFTGNFMHDSLSLKLGETAGSRVYLGFGSGSSYFQARFNARIALDASMNDQGECYYASETNELIGPLGKEGLHREPTRPDDALIALSQKYHMDSGNLQKILSFSRVTGSDQFTAAQLAEYLGITVRSGSRLLNRLVEHGGARSYSENHHVGRGRPVKYYQLLFEDE